ncbi:MAG TPA: SLBB domain-containing protein [Saprospiraceae bacterium]|nr:SLBB domain-containing protein [Saprospiraceae bacterium]HNT20376.1 SLBB domain-containing protein [Saprospiraceae bacterium]
MSRLFRYAFLFFIAWSLSVDAEAQIPAQAAPLQAELQRRGISEQELQARLLQKGVDLNDLQNLTAEQALQFQAIIEETINELEREKTGRAVDTSKPAVRSAPDTLASPKPDSTTPKAPDPPGTLKIYGQELFRNKSIQAYTSSENIKPPETYVLGVGDIVNVHVFGRSKVDFKNLEINSQGYIQMANYPRIYIKGLTYQQAREVVRKTLNAYFTFQPNEFEMTIDYSREISVNIFGEANQIGTFRLPATNTAINALVAAGGPNDIGSIRNIRLIRGRTVKKIDVYEFIANPAVAQDLYLEENDIIHIPLAERVVAVEGAVRRPMRYELIAGENLVKLIEYAGGLKDDAYRKNIQVRRFIDDKPQIIDVPLRTLLDEKSDFTLMSGDLVQIASITRPLEEFVQIDGQVQTPGSYQFTDGMRVSDLLEKGNLLFGAKTDLAFLMRLNENGNYSVNRIHIRAIQENKNGPENILLKARDRVMVYSLSYYLDSSFIYVSGAVRNPVRIPFDFQRNLRVSDLLTMSGGLLPDALDFGHIRRINKENYVEKDYITFNSKTALARPGTAEDPVLEPDDEILLYNDRTFNDASTISIDGAVRNPGSFAYGPGITLKDLVVLAGGFSLSAATNRIEVFRVVMDDNQPTRTVVATLNMPRDITAPGHRPPDFKLQPFDQVQVRAVPQFEMQQNVSIEGEVQFPGTYSLITENETITELLRRAGGPTQEAFLPGVTLFRTQANAGYIIFSLTDAIKSPSGPDNLVLKDGDRIVIPKVIDFVTIEGATDASELYQEKLLESNNRIHIAWVPGKNARYYVNEFAAGVAREGSKSRITVEQPNGRIARTKNYWFFKVYPEVEKGAVVKVGEKLSKQKTGDEERKKIDWMKVMADTLGQATAVLSFILLVRALDKQ